MSFCDVNPQTCEERGRQVRLRAFEERKKTARPYVEHRGCRLAERSSTILQSLYQLIIPRIDLYKDRIDGRAYWHRETMRVP